MLFRPSDSRAFAPFYDSRVRITGTRGAGASTRTIDGTFPACLLDNGYADPMGESNTQSTARTRTIYIPRTGPDAWRDETPPQRGDTITTLDGARWGVQSVDATDRTQFTMEVKEK